MVAARSKIEWVGLGLSVLLSLLFGMSAVMKLMGGPEVMEGMAHLGLPDTLTTALGILEITCVAVYLFPATSVVGAILLTGYIGGAICAHVRVGDPFLFQIVLGICVWLGLYLRENRLRELIPLRTSGSVDFAPAQSTNR
jgi:hypothetical protein